MKTERIDIRVSPETKQEWCSRAEKKGLSLTEYIIEGVEAVHTDTVHTGKKESPTVHTVIEESPDIPADVVRDAIAKCEKIGSDYKVRNKRENEFRSYFKDKKLN